MMTEKEIVEIMTGSKALLEGHFLLRSGLHSDRFFQAALVLQYPEYAEKLCRELAECFKDFKAETTVSPAIGGLIVGQEFAKFAGTKAIFAEKDGDNLVLRRGFSIRRGEKIIIAEDVVTRGGRVAQSIELAKSFGAEVLGVAALVDRSGGSASFGVPFKSLLKLSLNTYDPSDCPLCKAGIPLQRPGSK